MRIGILGAGNIGGTLARLWVQAGHEVMVSSRHPDELAGLAQELGGHGRAGSLEEAARFGEAVLLAVPFGALENTLKAVAGHLTGKVVIDAMNPFPDRDGPIAGQARARGASGLTTRDLLPGARVVRAFSSVRSGDLQAGAGRGMAGRGISERIAVPFASDDPQARETAMRLIRQAGFEPLDLGPLEDSRPLDPRGALFGIARPLRELQEILRQGGPTESRFTKDAPQGYDPKRKRGRGRVRE